MANCSGTYSRNTYPFKNSLSALLVDQQPASLKWCLSSRHSTACGDCKIKIYIYIYTYIYIYIYIYTCIYIYIYICIYICIRPQAGSVCKTSEFWKMTYQRSLTFNSACWLHIAATTDLQLISLISRKCIRSLKRLLINILGKMF